MLSLFEISLGSPQKAKIRYLIEKKLVGFFCGMALFSSVAHFYEVGEFPLWVMTRPLFQAFYFFSGCDPCSSFHDFLQVSLDMK